MRFMQVKMFLFRQQIVHIYFVRLINEKYVNDNYLLIKQY